MSTKLGEDHITDGISMRANYSYVRAQDKLSDDDVGDYPNHQLNMVLDWDIDAYWHVNLVTHLVGERRRTPYDTRPDLSGFTDISLNLSYTDTSTGIEVALSAKNLLDDDIFEPSIGPSSEGGTVNIPFDLPQAGTSIYLTASKDF